MSVCAADFGRECDYDLGVCVCGLAEFAEKELSVEVVTIRLYEMLEISYIGDFIHTVLFLLKINNKRI